jgi:hypothetical protein
MYTKGIICLVVMTLTCMATARKYSHASVPAPDKATNSRAAGQNDFHWQGVVRPGDAIEINGIFGTIRAEASSGTEVEVSANKHAGASNPDEVQLRTLKHDGGVTICAVYPRGDAGEPNQCQAGGGNSHTHNNDVRVDFTVRVPAGIRLIARTVDGDVDGSSLSGNVEAYSVMGNIRISTTGYVQAKTITGSITATVGNANWPGQIEFETSTGAISLELPAQSDTELRAESITGTISFDFPLAAHATVGRQNVKGTIGNGGRKLVLKTINGDIKLMRAT